MFTVDTIHQFLLDRNLITTNSLISGDYEVTSATRRNRNLQVTTLSEGDFLIKQVFDTTTENAKTVLHEIKFYKYFTEAQSSLKSFSPDLKYADEELVILILKFYKEATPLWRYYKDRSSNFPLDTIAAVGDLLGKLHAEFSKPEVLNDQRLSFLNTDLPFAFNMHKPHPKMLSYISPGGYQFIQKMQSSEEIMKIWMSLPEVWEVNALIHGDIKLDNFLVMDPSDLNNSGCKDIKIIDWEMAQFGDLAWDLAGALKDFIFWWTTSMPSDKSPEETVKNAAFPFQILQPGINSFWRGYCETCRLSEKAELKLLQKAILYSGIRVMQTAYEISSRFDAIPSIAAVLFNIGQGILKMPDEARIKVFGIHENMPVL
jgi:hypothetical protein